jgi:hypothetical protein
MTTPLPPLPAPTTPAEATLELLAHSHIVSVFLDPRHPFVDVPEQYRRQELLVLEIGLNLPVPLTDLVVDLNGIAVTLSFNRTTAWCPGALSVWWVA